MRAGGREEAGWQRLVRGRYFSSLLSLLELFLGALRTAKEERCDEESDEEGDEEQVACENKLRVFEHCSLVEAKTIEGSATRRTR